MRASFVARRFGLARAFATSAPGLRFPPVSNPEASAALQKYRMKLEAKAAELGFKSPEELLRNAAKLKPPAPSPTDPVASKLASKAAEVAKKARPARAPASNSSSDLPSYIKPLDKIVDVERLMEEDAARIELIWNEYHKSKSGVLSGVMQASFYNTLKARGKENPLFIIPLPRESGVEFYLMQIALNQIYYTSLLEYKTHQTAARPRLTLTHYDNFAESKGIVLMRGELDTETAVLKPDDARLLVLLTQMFYVTGNETKQKLVDTFNKNPQAFDYQTLIDESEKLA